MRKKDFLWLLDNTTRPGKVFVTSRVRGMYSLCLKGESFPKRLPDRTLLKFTGREIVLKTFAGTQAQAYKERDKYMKWFEKDQEK